MKYRIINIDGAKNTITVRFKKNNGDVIGTDQTMGDCPLDSSASLDAFLKDYGLRYKAGIQAATKPPVPAEITAVVGVDSVDDGI